MIRAERQIKNTAKRQQTAKNKIRKISKAIKEGNNSSEDRLNYWKKFI